MNITAQLCCFLRKYIIHTNINVHCAYWKNKALWTASNGEKMPAFTGYTQHGTTTLTSEHTLGGMNDQRVRTTNTHTVRLTQHGNLEACTTQTRLYDSRKAVSVDQYGPFTQHTQSVRYTIWSRDHNTRPLYLSSVPRSTERPH